MAEIDLGRLGGGRLAGGRAATTPVVKRLTPQRHGGRCGGWGERANQLFDSSNTRLSTVQPSEANALTRHDSLCGLNRTDANITSNSALSML